LLTDIPIGSFTSATVLDLIGGERGQPAADLLVALGVLAALPTAAAGASDWSDTYGDDQRTGVVHALCNVIGLGLYSWSLVARRRGQRTPATLLGLAGMSTMTVAGYLGGYLSYSRGIGVNNAFFHQHSDEWTPVLADAELAEAKPVRVEANGATVVLYRTNGHVLAIDSRCSHAGGPLEDGTFDETTCTVECPWHQSVFRLVDGSVVHGPASAPQAAYDVRVRDGQIEVRHRR
jgi:nitrite reductase/ring-hydroxylating ferredoxin subunit/uncharacterized membrane protein